VFRPSTGSGSCAAQLHFFILKIAKQHTASWLSTVGSGPVDRVARPMLNVFNDIEERVGRMAAPPKIPSPYISVIMIRRRSQQCWAYARWLAKHSINAGRKPATIEVL
jgi:hypothetical protein